jgi:hypothetical protein
MEEKKERERGQQSLYRKPKFFKNQIWRRVRKNWNPPSEIKIDY